MIKEALSVFISYSTRDKLIAESLKVELEKNDLKVFLAHEDISDLNNLEKDILDKLKQSQIFLPLLTDNFKNSFWTNQEIGIAVADKKIIIPLKINSTPYGFLAKHKALDFRFQKTQDNSYVCKDSCIEILKIIKEKLK